MKSQANKEGTVDDKLLTLPVNAGRAIAEVGAVYVIVRVISEKAQAVHGTTSEHAAQFESFESQWNQIANYLKDHLIVIHNTSFDWPILLDHVARYGFRMPFIKGVFCSQKAATP